jgi:hypothetical protein
VPDQCDKRGKNADFIEKDRVFRAYPRPSWVVASIRMNELPGFLYSWIPYKIRWNLKSLKPQEERSMPEEPVRAWAETVTIPTYPTGEPEKNPMFLEKRVYQGSSGAVYPYPVIEKS